MFSSALRTTWPDCSCATPVLVTQPVCGRVGARDPRVWFAQRMRARRRPSDATTRRRVPSPPRGIPFISFGPRVTNARARRATIRRRNYFVRATFTNHGDDPDMRRMSPSDRFTDPSSTDAPAGDGEVVVRTRIETSLPFIPALDGVRGVAILAVMLHNFSGIGNPTPTGIGRAFEWGWIGVQLFFVLSGFLITRILLDAGRAPGLLRAFMVRRVLRVVPLYYATLFVYFVVVPRLLDAPTIVAAEPRQLWYWLFLSNWAEPLGYGAPGLQHLWSIAVELQFYLLWPLVALGASERGLRRICLALIALSLVSLVGIRVGWSASASAVYKFTITRMSAPAIGALAALLTRRAAWCALYARYRAPLGWGSLGVLLALAVSRHGFQHTDAAVQSIGFTVVAFLFAQWLLTIVLGLPALGGALLALPTWKPLRTIGRLSYGMYILHYPLHWAAMKHLSRVLVAGPWSAARQLVYIAAAIAATTGLAAATWVLFERRFLALKRFFPVPHASAGGDERGAPGEGPGYSSASAS
jgi:peptidoglycan/LPS O-acetylase OafA/YrhL